MSRLLIVNGSYRDSGTTTKCLKARSKKIMEVENIADSEYIMISDRMSGCVHCEKCAKGCYIHDDFQDILKELEIATHILIGTPVYLDFPSPKLLAWISRLNCMAEPTNRQFFKGKKVYLHANGYCSGTKSAIGVLMNACEMLGFDIPARSTSEYIELWKDKKIRGGGRGEASFIK